MMNSEPKMRFITSDHLLRYEKFYPQLEKRAISVKEKIFLEFFGKNFRNYLDFQLKANPVFGSWVSNFNINIGDYSEMLQSFLYPIIIGKVQHSVEVLTNFVNTFKNLLNENNILKRASGQEFNYLISKMVTDFYKIEIYFWGCHYEMEESGNIKNLQIVKNREYCLREILDSFFTVSKNGEWYTDEGILQSGNIDEATYTKRYAEKFIKYRSILIENSIYAGSDPTTQTNLPDALIVGIKKSPDIEKISKETSQNIWKELKIEPKVLETLNSIDFYILGIEPISIDSMLVLNDLFR